MLLITATAASPFRDVLAREQVCGQTIRLVPETRTNGRAGITLQAINEPAPADAEARPGRSVVVVQELGSGLDDAVPRREAEQATEGRCSAPRTHGALDPPGMLVTSAGSSPVAQWTEHLTTDAYSRVRSVDDGRYRASPIRLDITPAHPG
jgi:hypothetical protein